MIFICKQKSMLPVLAIVMLVVPFSLVQAYLDPGSGSFIIQLIVGAILGSLVAIKIYFKNIKKSFIKLFSKKKTEQTNSDEQKKQE